jgi:hypothetical protein
VLDELARELIDGTGMAMKLRDHDVADASPVLLSAE